MNTLPLGDIELAAFHRDGFLVCRNFATTERCDELLSISRDHLGQKLAPIEYEVDVRYPGSPVNHDAKGADTARRLRKAYSRHEAFRRWATSSEVGSVLRRLFVADSIRLSQCHHNCIMTKCPGYSSATAWHQDNRYWSFDQENLISVWLALGDEYPGNGSLQVIPGTHQEEFDAGRLDAALFLRPELAENQTLLSQSRSLSLKRGDVLFFHSRLFHAAGRNETDRTKFSLVFTYHEDSNRPIQNTRSARYPSVAVY